ncbi:MAG: ABC transporter permease [Planctomycetes bacterium]|nr:ABC transporter permease [Planctomycetota bacterium]
MLPPLLLAFRYLLRRPTAILVTLVTAFSVCAILCVLSVLWGLKTELLASARRSGADITIENRGSAGWSGYEGLAMEIRGHPGVSACIPVLEDWVLLQHGGRKIPAKLRGVSWEDAEPFPLFRPGDDVSATPWPSSLPLPGEAGEIFVGRRFAERWRIPPGDSVTVIASAREPLASAGPGIRIVRRQMPVAGAFKTGDWFNDEWTVITDLLTAQRLLRMHIPSPAITSLQVRARSEAGAADCMAFLAPVLGRDPSYSIATVRDTHRWIFETVDMENAVMAIILCVVLVACAFAIGVLLHMMVREKTRDIGILRTLGFTAPQVFAIFLLLGLFVGVVGSAVGTGAGIALSPHLHGLTNWLSLRLTGQPFYFADAYYLDRLPSHIEPKAAAAVALFMAVLALLASALPALRASLLPPARTLRQE